MNAQLVQKAIVEDAWDRLLDLVGNCDGEDSMTDNNNNNIWWKPLTTTTGWTVMHFAASHFVPTEWWQWIVRRASQSDATAFWKQRTALGETVFDIFFKTYFQPLPWESFNVKKRSKFFRRAISIVMNDPKLQEDLKNQIISEGTSDSSLFVEESLPSNRAVERYNSTFLSAVDRVAQFIIHLKLLCIASMNHTGPKEHDPMLFGNNTKHEEDWVLQMLCIGVNFPKVIAELLVGVFPDVLTRIHSNPQPIHQWCSLQTIDWSNNNQCNGLVEVALEAFPDIALHKHPLTGRLPLEEALMSGKSWKQVAPLFTAAPKVLRDCLCGKKLPLFACAAVAVPLDLRNDAIEIMARRSVVRDTGLVSLWCLATTSVKQNATSNAQKDYECERLSTIFEVLIACPEALMAVVERTDQSADHSKTYAT